jgi:hypothetical protein
MMEEILVTERDGERIVYDTRKEDVLHINLDDANDWDTVEDWIRRLIDDADLDGPDTARLVNLLAMRFLDVHGESIIR